MVKFSVTLPPIIMNTLNIYLPSKEGDIVVI